MTARTYAFLWAFLVQAIKDYAYQTYNGWNPGVSLGEVSHYVPGGYCDCLEDFNTSFTAVPPNVSGFGYPDFPDVRYPNLVLRYYRDLGLPGTSPVTGLSLAASSFTYHDYVGGAATFVEYQRNAIKGIGSYSNPIYQFNNSAYLMGQSPYVGTRFALGEWGSQFEDGASAAQFFQDVWNNGNFQSLDDVLTSTYWYVDFDGYSDNTKANSAFNSSGGLAAVGTKMAST